MGKLPILIIIPHGGTEVPPEIREIAAVEDFELLITSDTCANEIFAFDKKCAAVLSTHISPLFIDLDKSYLDIPPRTDFGMIKKVTHFGKNVFQDDFFPDEIAISNMIRRYYQPFHDTLKKIISSQEVKLIIECHTSMPVGPLMSVDPDKPRPLVKISNIIDRKGSYLNTCPDIYCKLLLSNIASFFEKESCALNKPFVMDDKPIRGFIANNYQCNIPYMRLDICRSLYFNDRHFNFHFMKTDLIRINEIRKKILLAIEKTANKIAL